MHRVSQCVQLTASTQGTDQYYINPDECIDCGACEPECPVEAIFSEDAVPGNMRAYIAKNRTHFEGGN
jgi:NAD-dependent dihydropyrimidine dehydrogenase PreA subunit